MRNEAALWRHLDGVMGPIWHAQRHEDKHSNGIADVSYGAMGFDGWIELKNMHAVPRGAKPWDISWEKFTEEQRNWLTKRSRVGSGRVFLVCAFGPMVVAWRWSTIGPMLGNQNFEQIAGRASAIWNKGVIAQEAIQVFVHNRTVERRFQIG